MSTNIEYDDAYVIEEKTFEIDDDPTVDQELAENLTLDDLEDSDESYEKITNDYNKLKYSVENRKKNNLVDKVDLEKKKLLEFSPKIIKREEVVEDFIRNFFVQFGLSNTLEEFNKEFNELQKKGKFQDNALGPITDVHIKNAKLEERIVKMEKELEKAKKNAELAKSQWESLRKEREFHKLNFTKAVSDKEVISRDIKTLKKLHEDFISKIDDLKKKYENLCKQKSLTEMMGQKYQKEIELKNNLTSQMMKEIKNLDETAKKEILESSIKFPKLPPKFGVPTAWPGDRNNFFLMQTYPPLTTTPTASRTIKAHEKPIGCLATHIRKKVIATGCDDGTFKIFNMDNYDELGSGSGHTDYISGIDIHPKGLFLATCSGDRTVNVNDLSTGKNKLVYTDFKSIVWDVKFHDTGDFLLGCSDDSTIRLFDLNMEKARSIYYGHTDSVNKVNFQPFTNYFASASSDKTASIWDMRQGLTVQTFYGHLNSINDVVFNTRGDMLYSCDADGIVKAWDIRKNKEFNTFVHFPANFPLVSANCLQIDKTGNTLYVGYENGKIGVIFPNKKDPKEGTKERDPGYCLGPQLKLSDNTPGINGIGINLSNTQIYTVYADGNLAIWN